MLRFCLATALLCLASALPIIENADNPGRIPGEYLVVLKPGQNVQGDAAAITGISSEITLVNQFDALESPILHIKASNDLVISKAFNIPSVVHIEANVWEKKIEQCGSQGSGSTYWGLSRTSSRAAPSYGSATYNFRSSGGSGVRVYVLDTGIRTTHSDFSGGRAIFGTNTIGGGSDDLQGHGTHCAGTVVGGNSGVAKGATAVAVKVLNDQGFGSTASIVNGVNWAVSNSHFGGKVISMSLGGGASSSIDSAVNSANSAGVITVVAAGNENQNACNVSPARASGAFTVGATDISDNLSSFSNWGTCCNILAPGSNVRSASHFGDNSYTNMSGTSMACPHVAGAAAVYLARFPGSSPTTVKNALTSGGSFNYINIRGTSTPNILLYERC